MGRICIQAANIHAGGGAWLLRALISALPTDTQGLITLDNRFQCPDNIPQSMIKASFPGTFSGRFSAERYIAQHAQAGDILICFGNLPPLWKSPAKVVVLLHQPYLVEKISLKGFSLWPRLRMTIERLWLRFFMHHADRIIVQTQVVANNLRKTYPTVPPISLCTFAPDGVLSKVSDLRFLRSQPHSSEVDIHNGSILDLTPSPYDFVYIASSEPHKNHRCLIQAWVELARRGSRPRLAITLDHSLEPTLCEWIQKKIDREGLKITLLGRLPHHEVLALYQQARAMIFPSYAETLGLPLIEAQQAGLPIVASDAEFVREIIKPNESFDPHSPSSIADAVTRFLKLQAPREAELLIQCTDGAGFLGVVLEEEGVRI